VHVPLREDWTQTLLLVAGESLRRTEALRLARKRRAKPRATNSTPCSVAHDRHEHSVNNALTSMIGTRIAAARARPALKTILAQIKTIHSMACASTKSCSVSHRSPARCGTLRMLLK